MFAFPCKNTSAIIENFGKIEKNRVGLSLVSIFDETETIKIAPRRDQSCGLESWLQALDYCIGTIVIVNKHTI